MPPLRGHSGAPSWRSKTVLLGALLAIATGPMATGADDLGRAPARLVPARGLTFDLEYDGLDAHADAWIRLQARYEGHGPARPLKLEIEFGPGG